MATRNLRIYASEIAVLVSELAAHPDIETGGMLVGLWSHTNSPTVFLATRPGPKAQHEEAFFQQDTGVYRSVERFCWRRFGVQCVGLWHSHHRIGLNTLSGGDILRTARHARNTGLDRFCEILGFFLDEVTGLRPYVYRSASQGIAQPTRFEILPGTSPLRLALDRHGLDDEVAEALVPAPGPAWPPPRLLDSPGFDAFATSHPEGVNPVERAEQRAIDALAELIDRCVPDHLHDRVTIDLPATGRVHLAITHDGRALEVTLRTLPELVAMQWHVSAGDAPPVLVQPDRATDTATTLDRAIAALLAPPPPAEPPTIPPAATDP